MNTDDKPDEPTTAVAVREAPAAMPLMNAALVQQTMEALKTIRLFVAKELVEGTDYGTIPGAGDKKVMLLPGAQKVNMLYNCYPEYAVEEKDLGGGHAEFRVGTKLVHRGSGNVIGAGVGSCSTMESKYRWRTAGRVCPKCEKDTIKRSKYADRGAPEGTEPGWYCFGKIGGCGANFRYEDPAITGQQTGRAENPDIADQRNTVLKMAKKRSLVDASIGLGCLTELFTQDFGDEEATADAAPAPPPPPAPPSGTKIDLPWVLNYCGKPTPPDNQSLAERCQFLGKHLKRLFKDFDPAEVTEAITEKLGEDWNPETITPAQRQLAWAAVGEWVRGEAARRKAPAPA